MTGAGWRLRVLKIRIGSRIGCFTQVRMERELLLKVVTDFEEQLRPSQEPTASIIARQAASSAISGGSSGGARPLLGKFFFGAGGLGLLCGWWRCRVVLGSFDLSRRG